MKKTDFITELKRSLPQGSWPWVFASLRQDVLIWSSLEASLGAYLASLKEARLEELAPAALAFALMEYPLSPAELRSLPMSLAPEPSRDCEAIDESSELLVQAGAAALRLREQRRATGSWKSVAQDLSTSSPTALACLFGIIPDPLDFLRHVLTFDRERPSRDRGIHLVVNATLSNPLTPAAHIEILSALLPDLPPDKRFNFTRHISVYRPDLGRTLARRLYELLPDERRSSPPEDLLLAKIEASLRAVEIHQLAGSPDQAIPAIEQAAQYAHLFQAQLNARQARLASSNGDPEASLQAWERARELAPDSADYLAGLALALLEAGRSADAQAHLGAFQPGAQSAPLHLAHARLCFLRGEQDVARQAARRALEIAAQQANSHEVDQPDVPAILADLGKLFLRLDLIPEAVKAAELGLELSPNDPHALARLAQSQLASGDVHTALQLFNLAVTQAPENQELQRQLADILEIAGEWRAALEEWVSLIGRLSSPSPGELRALANVAINAGEPGKAAQICTELLNMDATDGLACALLGMANAALGEAQSALDYLQRATELSPGQAEPWLALARFHTQSGQAKKALEALRAATLAAPEQAEIHLVLGEAHLQQASPTLALNAFRSAVELISSHPAQPASLYASYHNRRLRLRISLRLGQSLRQLGHFEEARQTLEAAHNLAPYDLELAQEYALVLLDLHEARQALSPLQIVLENDPQNADPYLQYAGALLSLANHGASGLDICRAVAAIRRALEISPDHPEATGLLAEALALSGDKLAAIGAYQNALESSLAEDPAWQARLSLGLGRVALELGQIETALVALQEAGQVDPSNPQVQRSLSEAYCAAGLIEDALQAARAAQILAPTDIQNLTWFASQVLSLQEHPGFTSREAQSEAIQALEQAARLAPNRTDILVLLGYNQIKAGDHAAARDSLRRLVDIPDPETGSLATDLFQAAQALMDLQDPSGAVACLRRALQCGPGSQSSADPSLLNLLTALAAAHYQVGDLQASLQALDQALQLATGDARLYLDKAGLLLEIAETLDSSLQDAEITSADANSSAVASGAVTSSAVASGAVASALDCARTALELDPQNLVILRKAALLHRRAGALPAALTYAELLIALSADSIPQTIFARTLAGDIARALLQPERARNELAFQIPEAGPASQVDNGDWVEFYCLRGELALEVNDEPTALKSLEETLEIASGSARMQLIQARLSQRHGDRVTALSLYRSAIQSLEAGSARMPMVVAAAETALELHEWEDAIRLWERVASLAGQDPFSYLSLARALVERAEFQRLCQASDVVRRAPGEDSLSEQAYEAFSGAVQRSQTLISKLDLAQDETARQTISRWSARGQAVFQDALESVEVLGKLPAQIDDVAAQVALLHRLKDDTAAGRTARIYPHSPLILIHLAAALGADKPRQALAAAHAAIEILSSGSGDPRPGGLYPQSLLKPVTHYLLARLYHHSGNRSGDHNRAMEEILIALDLWPDEPRWNTLAADIYLWQNRLEPGLAVENAVVHLEQAIELEPHYVQPYIRLGHIHLERGASQRAIQVLEPASQLQGDNPELWLLLAQAYREVNDLDQAADCAEKAVSLSPNQIQPLLLRGEIALQAGNPKAAQGRAQAALRINPDDPYGLLLMARVLNALNRQEEALFMIDRALPLAIDPLPISLEKIRLLRQSRGKDETLSAIRLLAQDHPQEPAVLALLAEICDQIGHSEEAIQAAQRALHAEGTSLPLNDRDRARLHYLLGRLFRAAGQLDQSVHHLAQALQLDSHLVEAYLELGGAYQERREHNQAINALQQAIKVAPDDYRAYHQVGLALKESKDYLGAEKMLRRAAELAPQDPAIHRLLAAVVALNLVHNRRETPRDVPLQM